MKSEDEIKLETVNAQIQSIESELEKLKEFRLDLIMKINLDAYSKSTKAKMKHDQKRKV